MLHIPEGLFPVSMIKPTTTNTEITTDYLSLKNVVRAWIVVHLTQAVGHATLITPKRATAVDGTGAAVLTNVVPIWYGNVTTSTSALTRQTDAVNYTMGGSVTGDVYVIFQIDPENLGSTYDVLGLVIAASSQATNFAEVTCWVQPKFPAKTADTQAFITD